MSRKYFRKNTKRRSVKMNKSKRKNKVPRRTKKSRKIRRTRRNVKRAGMFKSLKPGEVKVKAVGDLRDKNARIFIHRDEIIIKYMGGRKRDEEKVRKVIPGTDNIQKDTSSNEWKVNTELSDGTDPKTFRFSANDITGVVNQKLEKMSKVININSGDNFKFKKDDDDETAEITYNGITSTFDYNGVVLSSDGNYYTITTSGTAPEPEPQVAPLEPEPQVETEAAPIVYRIHRNTVDGQGHIGHVRDILVKFNSKRISKPEPKAEAPDPEKQREAAEREREREKLLRPGDDAPHGVSKQIAEKKKGEKTANPLAVSGYHN